MQTKSQPAEQGGSASILDGYFPEKKFAEDNNTTQRTIARYRHLPDGLPWTLWSGRVWIPIEEGRAWLKSRVRHPNNRRS
ncbi:hypothetical protein [Bradyrhizobium jicamae]|uniref:hypothetical protein n=1 Tax=Bradyrhizobium jicamae TaxID=280332 RepID=UPI000ABB9C5B|nr:hypothetical protein [Bradyrhizobium jicamae]